MRANGSFRFDMLRLISSLLGNSLCFQGLDQRKTLAAMLAEASLNNKAGKNQNQFCELQLYLRYLLSLWALSGSEAWS